LPDITILENWRLTVPKERFKDFTLNERTYRLGLVPADIGNWIITQITTGQSAKFENFSKIQAFLFERISVYKGEGDARLPLKIYDGGRWLVPDLDLEYDTDTISSLFEAAMEFNFDPFFQRLQKTLSAVPTSDTNL
jgi:hypothetical protein